MRHRSGPLAIGPYWPILAHFAPEPDRRRRDRDLRRPACGSRARPREVIAGSPSAPLLRHGGAGRRLEPRSPLCTRPAAADPASEHDQQSAGNHEPNPLPCGHFWPADPLHDLRVRSTATEHGREVNATVSARVKLGRFANPPATNRPCGTPRGAGVVSIHEPQSTVGRHCCLRRGRIRRRGDHGRTWDRLP